MNEEEGDESISKQMLLAQVNELPLRALRSFKGVENSVINSLIITLNQLLK